MGADTERNTRELLEALNTLSTNNNIISLREFESTYAKMFVKDGITDHVEISTISAAFMRRFDLYREINVMEGDRIIFTIPQLLFPVRDISAEYTDTVDSFRTDSVSDIPRRSSESVGNLLSVWLKSQHNVDGTGFGSFGEYLKHTKDEYARNQVRFAAKKLVGSTQQEQLKEDSDDRHASIDRMPGLSWD